jgi:hypothetical protein
MCHRGFHVRKYGSSLTSFKEHSILLYRFYRFADELMECGITIFLLKVCRPNHILVTEV